MDLQPKAVAIQPLPAPQRSRVRQGLLQKRGRETKQLPAGKSDYGDVSDNDHGGRGYLESLSDVSVRGLHAGRTEHKSGSTYHIDPPFRQLSIGSPVPCLDNDDADSDDEDDERPSESRGSDPPTHPERYFAHDCIITRKVSPKVSAPVLPKRKNTTPSIKVDRCEGQFHEQVSFDENSSDGSCSGSPLQGDGMPMHSPPGDGKLLSPTQPPPCRMSGEHRGLAAAVTYHNTTPLAVLSRSENSITDAIIKEHASFKGNSSGIEHRSSPRMSRSVSSTPISVTNTDMLRSPASSPRNRRARGPSSDELPKLDYRHGSRAGGRALGGTVGGHSPGRTPTSSPVRGGPSPRHRHGKELSHQAGPRSGNDMSFPRLN